MKTWLKGGLIGAGLDLIILLIAIITSSPTETKFLAVGFVQLPFSYILSVFGSSYLNYNFSTLILGGLVIYFIIGTIIGWIIHKIKSINLIKK